MQKFVDTHAHLDGEEFDIDRQQVIDRARQAGAAAILLPAIDLASTLRIQRLCSRHKGFLYPMAGLHPEEVTADWAAQLQAIRDATATPGAIIAVGEVGLDYYWSREMEKEQLAAFEAQVEWSVESGLPLMIHCRKAQNDMVRLLRRYERQLPGGVFHCFTGNAIEAAELMQFERFALGIGGVFTFKKSPLPQVLPASVPLERIVLETDAPYMAPVPHRGQRNESSFIPAIVSLMATAYSVSEAKLIDITTRNVERIFRLNFKED